MTQATEAGTVYTLDEIDAIAKIAKTTACRCIWTARGLQMRFPHSAPRPPK